MEREPVYENESDEDKLIRLLKERGPRDSEARDLLIRVTMEKEKKVEESNDPEEAIQLNLWRARLYFKTGYLDEAFENFTDALTQAENEHRSELCKTILKEMKDRGLIEEEK